MAVVNAVVVAAEEEVVNAADVLVAVEEEVVVHAVLVEEVVVNAVSVEVVEGVADVSSGCTLCMRFQQGTLQENTQHQMQLYLNSQ